ncbi:MAG: IMP cyclohydrolase [Candidatus Geothermarchaeales archaeon]
MRRALISVSDKRRLDDLVSTLNKYGFEIISSGGTARRIRKLGYEVKEVSQVTGFPEMPGGLVKTLHPRIHGGILGDPSDEEQARYMEEQGIEPIDMVVVNPYPFEEVMSRRDLTLEEAVEKIDIGGVALMRSGAKGALQNKRVVVVTDPSQYETIMRELEENEGSISPETRVRLAVEAFRLTLRYEAMIGRYLQRELLGGEDV